MYDIFDEPQDGISLKLKPVVWTLPQGQALATDLEDLLVPLGYHVALGGGVLHKGFSRKDLDLFIYPHDAGNGEAAPLEPVILALEDFGIEFQAALQDYSPKPTKDIHICSYGGRRLDLFFVS